MGKAKSFAITLISVAIFWGIVFWIAVPYIADDTNLYYLKKPSYVEILVGFILFIMNGGLRNYARNNMGTSAGSNNSSKGIATAFILIGTVMFFIPLARLGLPFLSSVIHPSIPKAKGSEFIFWFVVLAVGSAILEFGISLVRFKFVGASSLSDLARNFSCAGGSDRQRFQ